METLKENTSGMDLNPSKLTTYLVIWGLGVIIYLSLRIWNDPLAQYPGPFIAKFSNLWMCYHTWSCNLPEKVLELHRRHGPVVRVGPNNLDFDGKAAIPIIYKAGRSMPKSDFYQGFTAIQPNLFGTQDEDVSMTPIRIIGKLSIKLRDNSSFMHFEDGRWLTASLLLR
jgi:hypothetical protein